MLEIQTRKPSDIVSSMIAKNTVTQCIAGQPWDFYFKNPALIDLRDLSGGIT